MVPDSGASETNIRARTAFDRISSHAVPDWTLMIDGTAGMTRVPSDGCVTFGLKAVSYTHLTLPTSYSV